MRRRLAIFCLLSLTVRAVAADSFSSKASGVESASSKTGAENALIEVPSGTLFSVELVDPVHSGKNKAGDTFRGRVLEGVWVHSAVVIPPGTTVRGSLPYVRPSGRVAGQSKLELTLQTLEMDGKSYTVHTDTLSYVGDSHAGFNFGSWFGGALQGALYGMIFGGKTGAVIGAGAGTAAGGVGTVLKGKQDVDFGQGAKLMFETTAPLRVPAGAVSPSKLPASKPSS